MGTQHPQQWDSIQHCVGMRGVLLVVGRCISSDYEGNVEYWYDLPFGLDVYVWHCKVSLWGEAHLVSEVVLQSPWEPFKESFHLEEEDIIILIQCDHELNVVPIGDSHNQIVLDYLVIVLQVVMNIKGQDPQRCGVFQVCRHQLLEGYHLLREIDYLLVVRAQLKCKHK